MSVDYTLRAQMPDFESGITRLLRLARERPTTILCAEENPACCHRRLLVTPALQRAGLHVVHLRGDGRLEADADTPARQLALFR